MRALRGIRRKEPTKLVQREKRRELLFDLLQNCGCDWGRLARPAPGVGGFACRQCGTETYSLRYGLTVCVTGCSLTKVMENSVSV